MRVENFEKELEKLNLTKKEFAEIVGMPYQTLMNWNKTGQTPYWVFSWLQNYIKSKSYEEVKNKVLDIEGIKGE